MISLCFNYGGGGTSGNGSTRALVASLESESERTLTPAQKEEVAAIREACTCIPNLAVYAMVVGVNRGGDRSLGGDIEELEDVDEEEPVEDIDDREDLTENDGFGNDFYGDRRRIER